MATHLKWKSCLFSIFIISMASFIVRADEKPTLSKIDAHRLAKIFEAENSDPQNPLAFQPLNDSLTFEILKNYTEKEKPTSPDQILDFIYKTQPLAFAAVPRHLISRSLQSATLEKPRAIPTSANGRMAISFNAHGMKGGNRLEVIDFDPTIDPVLKQPLNRVFEINFDEKPAHWKEKTDECASCHAARPGDRSTIRFLWDNYAFWPRTYNGTRNSDEVASKDFLHKIFQVEKDQKKVPRYQHIHNLPYYYSNGEPGASDAPNDLTGDKFHFWNILRLSARIRSDPHFEQIKYALLIALEQADPLSSANESETRLKKEAVVEALGGSQSALGKEYLKRYSILFPEYKEAIESNVESYYDSLALSGFKISRDPKNANGSGYNDRDERYIKSSAIVGALFSLVGIDIRDYSTEVARGVPAFGGSSQTQIGFMIYDLTDEVVDRPGSDGLHPKMDALLNAWTKSSQKSIKNFVASPMPERANWSAPQLLKSDCSGCHAKDNDLKAPFYDFEDIDAFKSALTPDLAAKILSRVQEKDPQLRMPYAYPKFLPHEVETLRSFLSDSLQEKKSASSEFSCEEPLDLSQVFHFLKSTRR